MEKFNQQEKYLGKYEIDSEGYVCFADIARELLGKQTQYASRLIDGLFPDDYPNLGEGLRFKNVFREGRGTGNYFDYMIYKDDIDEFTKRAKDYYKK